MPTIKNLAGPAILSDATTREDEQCSRLSNPCQLRIRRHCYRSRNAASPLMLSDAKPCQLRIMSYTVRCATRQAQSCSQLLNRANSARPVMLSDPEPPHPTPSLQIHDRASLVILSSSASDAIARDPTTPHPTSLLILRDRASLYTTGVCGATRGPLRGGRSPQKRSQNQPTI